MEIDFTPVTGSHFIADETTVVASATTLKAAENAAVNAFGGSGVAYFSFHGNEYFIATANVETVVSSHDAIVELVGITDIHHAANNFGLVTLHV
jgi:predicted HAD superfamily phosphohydrolase